MGSPRSPICRGSSSFLRQEQPGGPLRGLFMAIVCLCCSHRWTSLPGRPEVLRATRPPAVWISSAPAVRRVAWHARLLQIPGGRATWMDRRPGDPRVSLCWSALARRPWHAVTMGSSLDRKAIGMARAPFLAACGVLLAVARVGLLLGQTHWNWWPLEGRARRRRAPALPLLRPGRRRQGMRHVRATAPSLATSDALTRLRHCHVMSFV